LIGIRATSADLRRVGSIDAKTVGVAAAHDVAAAKVGVAQKPCQLHPGIEKGPATTCKSCNQQDEEKRERKNQAYVQEKNKGRKNEGRKEQGEEEGGVRLGHLPAACG
jgi:hypothetical protein